MSGRGRGRGSTLPAWMTNQNGREGSNSNHQGPPRSQQQGLGYNSMNDDISSSWERGRGRGDSHNSNFVREENSAVGMGRGRGRGRGRGINNRPAWMTSSAESGPSGQLNTNASANIDNGAGDDEMAALLAQARQKRDEQQKKTTVQSKSASSSLIPNDGGTNTDDAKRTKSKSEIEQEELQKRRRKIEEDAKDAARKLEKEAKRIEQLKEEEEQRQLRALVGDLSDDGDDNMKKRKDRNEEGNIGDDDDDMFQFETEEEREARQARRLRKERRRKLRRLEQKNDLEAETVNVPRNVPGIILSEKSAEKDSSVAIKMEVDMSDVNVGNNKSQEDGNSDDDSFDMFATTDNATPVPTQHSKNATNSKNDIKATAQECDDVDGYYKANIGEIITLPREIGADDTVRFRVLGIIGKGVFSSVIKCVQENDNGAQQDVALSRVVAMKVIRNNEVMARAAAKEMRILRMLCSSSRARSKSKNMKKGSKDDTDDGLDKDELQRLELENHNIVRLLEVDAALSLDQSNGDAKAFSAPPLEFRSHCIFLFEYLPHNLREVLNKFGKNVGINLTAVKSYARQLLCALRHLEKHRIVHSDIKPDNILVSANFSSLKLCDFGSAFFETDHDNNPTPYLVSRFYRPPEVILGLEYDRMVDLWSVGVTLSELYTGSVLFPGNSNNDMLKKFMDTMGPFSFKMVRRHTASFEKMGLEPHFEIGNIGGTFEFRKQDLDKVTGQPIVRVVNVLTAQTEASLATTLLKSSKVSVSERVEVLKFANFLNRSLQLDPARRLGVRDALQHEFFQKKKKKGDTTA